MKTCPVCGTATFDDVKTCYGCLCRFDEEAPCSETSRQRYVITAWTFTTVLVDDIEFDGMEVVIGIYGGKNANEAKSKAMREYRNIPMERLAAYKISD